MTGRPVVVLGLPLYEGGEYLVEALESLLAQTYESFAIVAVDDGPSGGGEATVRRYAERDPRIHYERNAGRLGLTANWKRVFVRGRELYPGARYFAWASDHDLWHPRFLAALVSVLDANPSLVGAFPTTARMRADTCGLRVVDELLDTSELDGPLQRVRVATHGMVAGDMVYGLFRCDAVERAGGFRNVLLPDRMFLTELAVQGGFLHVDEILWYRRWRGGATYDRQRRSFFPDGAPAHAYLPPVLTHTAVLAWQLGLKGTHQPTLSRGAGLELAVVHAYESTVFQIRRSVKKRRRLLRRRGRELKVSARKARVRLLRRAVAGR